jgi:hypothetical protein
MNDFTNDQEKNQIRNMLSETQDFDINDDTENSGSTEELNDRIILAHFDYKPTFKDSRSHWPRETTALFCRLARAVHLAGLDWYFIAGGNRIRLGRKAPGSKRASDALGIIVIPTPPRNNWRIYIFTQLIQAVGDESKLEVGLQPLTNELITKLETAFILKRAVEFVMQAPADNPAAAIGIP